MCAKTAKMIQLAKAAGYVPDPKSLAYGKCVHGCSHNRVVWFVKDKTGKGRAKGPEPYGACFGCGARYTKKAGKVVLIPKKAK